MVCTGEGRGGEGKGEVGGREGGEGRQIGGSTIAKRRGMVSHHLCLLILFSLTLTQLWLLQDKLSSSSTFILQLDLYDVLSEQPSDRYTSIADNPYKELLGNAFTHHLESSSQNPAALMRSMALF